MDRDRHPKQVLLHGHVLLAVTVIPTQQGLLDILKKTLL